MARNLVGQPARDSSLGDFIEHSAIVWKTALGSMVVWELARFTGSGHPYLAPLTFILCLQATIGQSIRYAIYRSAGTVIGVLLIGAFATSIPVTAWALGIALLVTTVLMKLFRANDLLIHQVALSVLFVLYFENHSSGYAWDRAKDTLIGAIVALVFTILIFPSNEVKKTRQAMITFVRHFVSTVHLVADNLRQTPLTSTAFPSEQIDSLFDELTQVAQLLKKMEQGLPVMVYVKTLEVQRVQKEFHALRGACVHFAALTRSFTEDMTKDQREYWSAQLKTLATELVERIHATQPRTTSMGLQGAMSVFESEVSHHEFEQILGSLKRSKG